MIQSQQVKAIARHLLYWMLKANFRGWDPHDGLNSPLLTPLSRLHPYLGIVVLQLIKRSPLNLRPLLGVQKTVNAKALGLIISGLILQCHLQGEYLSLSLELARTLASWLEKLVTPGFHGACWGYPFDWPNRAFFAPQGMPTIVNTAFIGHAMCDLFEKTGEGRWLDLANSACVFISRDLNRTTGKEGFSFSYTPLDRSCVHNANLLGASLMARVGNSCGKTDYIDLARESVSYSIAYQRQDGSWPYGEAANQGWVDSFHTTYNLLALHQINAVTLEIQGVTTLDKGYQYYLEHFFTEDGLVKFYDNRQSPLDAHAFATAILCLSQLSEHPATPADLSTRILENMISLFWSGQGYFFYQRHNGLVYSLPCLRWVQAWVFLAIESYQNAQGARS